MRAGADHIAVGKEAVVRDAEDLLQRPLLDKTVFLESREEVLRQRVIARRRGAAEMIERQIEPPVDVGLHLMLPRAVGGDLDAGLRGRKLRRRAVLVGRANEKRFRSRLPAETGMDVGGQQRAREIAEMLDAVDVRQRTGDEIFGHDALRRKKTRTLNQKALRRMGGLGSASSERRAPSIPPASLLRGGHSHREAG